MDFEFIDENEIQAVRRGRKTTAPAELVKALGAVPKGKVVLIREFALDPTADDYKSAKSTVSATIRTAGKLAGVKVGIRWSPAGVPQVMVSPLPPKGKK